MGWISQSFADRSLAWLLVTTIVALLAGVLSSWLTSRFVKRPEMIDEARLQADIRKQVEVYLGEKSAEREYNLEARKRLYHAIGPLRFQLVVACRDAASRITNYGAKPDKRYKIAMDSYYGRSTLYRLLRPIAIAELIEQQITYADFSVDEAALGLLRFKRAAYDAFTDGNAILNDPKANWGAEAEHLFSGTLSSLANSLIIHDEQAANNSRPMYFHEFDAFIRNPKNTASFAPLADILEGFNFVEKPIFWVRLVCFGYICNQYLAQEGKAIGVESFPFDLAALLSLSRDEYTCQHLEQYQGVFQSL